MNILLLSIQTQGVFDVLSTVDLIDKDKLQPVVWLSIALTTTPMSGRRTGNYHSDALPIPCRVTHILVLLVLAYARPLRFLPLNTNSEICDDLPELSNCQFYHFIAYVMTRPIFDLKMPEEVFTLQGLNIIPSYGSNSIHTCTVLTCSKNRYSNRRLTLYLRSLVSPLFHLANSLPKKLFKLSSRLGYSCCKNGN